MKNDLANIIFKKKMFSNKCSFFLCLDLTGFFFSSWATECHLLPPALQGIKHNLTQRSTLYILSVTKQHWKACRIWGVWKISGNRYTMAENQNLKCQQIGIEFLIFFLLLKNLSWLSFKGSQEPQLCEY